MSFIIPLNAQAARALGPPLAEFINDRNRTAHVTLVKKFFGNKVATQVNDYISNEDENRLMLNIDRDVLAGLQMGEDYLIVFSRMRKHPLYRDGWEVNPKGPSLVKVRGLDTPAIYRSSPALRTLLTPPALRDEVLTGDGETALLLSVAENLNDQRARELAIFEMYLRPDLVEAISIDNAERFAELTSGADIRLRTFLLRTAQRFPAQRKAGWIDREWRRAAMDAGVELDLSSYEPLLVKIALEGLREHGDEEDMEIISKHMYANNPGVAKAALAALDAIDAAQALEIARQVMQSKQDLHMTTRQAFARYIEGRAGA